MVSNKRIREFKQILREDYKKSLTESEAREVGENLAKLFDLLIQIDQRENK